MVIKILKHLGKKAKLKSFIYGYVWNQITTCFFNRLNTDKNPFGAVAIINIDCIIIAIIDRTCQVVIILYTQCVLVEL